MPTSGIDLRSLDKSAGSPFILNTIPRNNELRVRAGFGTQYVFGTTLNAGRNATAGPVPDFGTFLGIGPPIGATSMRTSFGHDQIISVHPLFAFAGNSAIAGGKWGTTDVTQKWTSQPQGSFLRGISVHIHDVTTNRHVEFVLHEQDTQSEQLRTVYPHYSTRFNIDNSRWIVTPSTPTWVIFAQLQREMLITVEGCGTFYYRPVDPAIGDAEPYPTRGAHEADPAGNRQLDSLNIETPPSWTGEQSAIAPLTLHDGIFAADGVAYLHPEDLGQPIALCTLENRACYAVGNTVWLSDPAAPEEIAADNFVFLPTADPITMLAQVRGNLVIATKYRTWLFQPNQGKSNITGQLLDLSVGIGCTNNQSYTNSGDLLIWTGSRGAYSYNGGLDIHWLSEPVDAWWNNPQSLQMPLTAYFTDNGKPGLTGPQPPIRIDVPAQNFRVVWQEERKTAYFVSNDIILLWTDKFGWHVWQMLSQAATTGAVLASANIANPILAPIRNELYMVAGPDETVYNSANFLDQTYDSSCYLLRYGRGGALDRSTDAASTTPTEDQREPIGGWQRFDSATLRSGSFWFGQPTRLPAGYRSTLQTFTTETWWFPVYVSDPGHVDLQQITLIFKFDNANWTPLFKPAVTANLDVNFPAEMIVVRDKWGYTAPDATHEIRCYLAGALSNAGDEIRMRFLGTGGTWDFAPVLVIEPKERNLLAYLPFKRATNDTVTQLGIDPSSAIIIAPNRSETANVWRWETGSFTQQIAELAAKCQPVDYAIKSKAIHTTNYDQIRINGTYLRVRSYGNGADKQIANWPIGPVNTTTSTDYKDWCAQNIDMGAIFTGVQATTQQLDIAAGGVRARHWDAITKKIWQKVGNLHAKWSSLAARTSGNLLIDDAAVDTVQASDGSIGESASIMVFGTMNSPGAGVSIGSMQPTITPTGGRKRIGRQ